MDQMIVEKLFDIAPQLGFFVLFLIALALLLREYRNLRTEMKQSVEDAVNARLGSLMGDLQIESGKASRILTDITSTHEKAQEFSRKFREDLMQRASEINDTFEAIESKLAVLQQSVPKQGALKYSARDFAALAAHVTSLAEAIDLLAHVADDQDATSKDLEDAGDVARKFRRFSLARELYQKACDLDADNVSAKTELLALLAETDAKNRPEHLAQLTQTVLEAMDLRVQRRVANVLIELERYDDLAGLCRRILDASTEPNSPLLAQAHRDIAVSLKEKGNYPEAEKHFKNALSITPDDENLLKAYIGLLSETNEHGRALSLAKKLVTLDALDWHYHVILAREYVALEQYDSALLWFTRAEPLVPSGAELQAVEREKKKVTLLKEFTEEDHVSPNKALEATLDGAPQG